MSELQKTVDLFAAKEKAMRRERIATAALQGLLVNGGHIEDRSVLNLLAKTACHAADCLIAELDKEPHP